MAEPMYHSQLPDYLESLVPERDPVMQEMEAYAKEVGFPIIGIPGGYFLYQIARVTGARGPAQVRAVVPLGRWQQPADVADMAVFLSSDRAAQVTGQTINVDGGWVMHW